MNIYSGKKKKTDIFHGVSKLQQYVPTYSLSDNPSIHSDSTTIKVNTRQIMPPARSFVFASYK